MSRFKGKFLKMIKDADVSLNFYFIFPMIRQVLLHWDYELVENVCSYKNELLSVK